MCADLEPVVELVAWEDLFKGVISGIHGTSRIASYIDNEPFLPSGLRGCEEFLHNVLKIGRLPWYTTIGGKGADAEDSEVGNVGRKVAADGVVLRCCDGSWKA